MVMHPLDRRGLAVHVYSLISSLRKTAVLLQVSHTTVARWLKAHAGDHAKPCQKPYTRSTDKPTKAATISTTIRAAILNDPFISAMTLATNLQQVFGFAVSRQLVSSVIRRQGFTRKKARFFGQPADLEAKTTAFLRQRDAYVAMGRPFYAMDETGFGRHTPSSYGYAPSGVKLRVRKRLARCTTTSVLAIASPGGVVVREARQGSFNTTTLLSFLSRVSLERGAVILLDNVAFHHAKAVRDLAAQRGWDLLFTPPYSPWFNPIEGMFSIVKRDFYKRGDIDAAFSRLEARHATAFFRQSMSLIGQPR
jgi:transposase